MAARKRAVGRVRSRPLGRARVGRSVGVARTPERARTEVLGVAAPAHRTQVFVDDSGRRGRRLRRVVLVLVALVLVLVAVLWLSQYGGPVGPGR